MLLQGVRRGQLLPARKAPNGAPPHAMHLRVAQAGL